MSVESPAFADFRVVKPAETNPAFSLKGYFAGLPVASNTNLEILTPLLGQNPDVNLRKQIINRYLDIYNRRRSVGLYGPPEVDMQMAIAMVDFDSFTAMCGDIHAKGEEIKVATHEWGHAFVGYAVGWNVGCITVVPDSSSLGSTYTSPKAEKALWVLMAESIAISYGGGLAAKMAGHEVKGTGSDMASAQAKANIALMDPDCPFSTAEEISTYSEGLAHRALSSIGASKLHNAALGLAEKKTIV